MDGVLVEKPTHREAAARAEAGLRSRVEELSRDLARGKSGSRG
jgi:hypothetical protein